jgi:hypothetical protein
MAQDGSARNDRTSRNASTFGASPRRAKGFVEALGTVRTPLGSQVFLSIPRTSLRGSKAGSKGPEITF